MNTPKILVVKIPRHDPITDKPVNFQSFDIGKLHLELLEIKKKLKKHIPAITVRKNQAPKQPDPSEDEESAESDEDETMGEFKVTSPSAAAPTQGKAKQSELPAPTSPADAGDDADADADEDEDAYADVEGGNDNRLSVGEPELSPEEKEKLDQEEKEELIVKFRTLKKAYPQNKELQLLSYTEHDDLETMKKMYKRTVGEIAFDRKISNYRSYLSVSFMVIEYGFRHLGMNMEGFAKHQAKSIDDYNSLLVELGEKSQGSWMDNFPVEVRLLGLVLFQAVVFWFAKNKNIDISNIMNVVSGMAPKENIPAGVELPDDSASTVGAPARRMRGPSIKPR